MRAVVVVGSARIACLEGFLEAWRDELAQATIVVVEDGPERTFGCQGGNVRHYARADVEAELGQDAWIVPTGSGCVRSFGCWIAHGLAPDMIVSLDDDVRPEPDGPGFLEAHWARLQPSADPAWEVTLDVGGTRGTPYFATDREAQVVVNHGLWNGMPDFDAATHLVSTRMAIPTEWRDRTIPRGKYFPMCSMNLAWRAEFTPAMYFLLMGPQYPFDRFGDIWAGVLAKRVADHLGLAMNSGSPAIRHERASDVFANLAKESRGLAANETFWRAVDSVLLTEETVAGAYAQLAERLPLEQPEFVQLRRAMRTWAGLFTPGRERPADGSSAAAAAQTADVAPQTASVAAGNGVQPA